MCQVKGIALITGAASGIGKATAHALAKNGITGLALVDVNLPLLLETQTELQSQYPQVEISVAEVDVTDEIQVGRVVDSAVECFGRIDIGVNCAGISGRPCQSHELPLADWQKVIAVNQTGLWVCQRAMIRQMLKQESRGVREGRGVIVNISSAFGVSAPSGLSIAPYTASKHAVVGITRMDAMSYAKEGIRINAICPGYVNTPMTRHDQLSSVIQSQYEKIPMGRTAAVEEIADSILFLASPMSSYMCGAAMVVDGGFTV